jgi:Ca-activated chloride channel family protein
MAAPFVSGAQNSLPSNTGSSGEYTLKLSANMVILNATVLDRHNTSVSGLNKDDFQVYEDKQLQRIKQFSRDDIPVTVGIIVDNSGSMSSKRDDVIAAALAFAHFSNPLDQMFVVHFNDSVSFGLPPSIQFTSRQAELQSALARIRTIGQTALYDGILAGLDHLKQGTSDKKVLILISDGGDTASTHRLAQLLALARQSTAIIYAIGIFDAQDEDRDPGVLKRLSKETGGEAFFPESSKEAISICEEIARDIRSQYTLAYVPRIAAEDGSYRTVEVKASMHGRGRLSVRTRPGYSVPIAMPSDATKASLHDSRK